MSKQGCSCLRILSMCVTLAIIGAMGYVTYFFLGSPTTEEVMDMASDITNTVKNIDFGDFTDVLKNFTGFSADFFNEDPFVGDNTTNLWVGHTRGEGGLTLQLWNALDDSWQQEYSEAVNDWNTFCDPKVLVLTTTDVPVEYNECTQEPGLMKVCNGNYGDKGWLGINEVLKSVPGGIIQSSVAKMNEHYLANADYDERLYTMCHELGHGYGLPHTDENFNNKDLENCLDYTNSPSNNLRPGIANCQRLYEMYGSVNYGRRNNKRTLRYRSDAEMYEDFEIDTDEYEIAAEEEENTATNYNDDARYYFEDARSQYPDMSAEYEKAMEELYYEISQGNVLSPPKQQEENEIEENTIDEDILPIDVRGKWRCLREHPRGADFSRRLNDGFILEVHVLFPSSSR